MARSKFLPRPVNSPVTDADIDQLHTLIGRLLAARAEALRRCDVFEARLVTRRLIDAYCALGERSPAFEPTIQLNGQTYWLAGFNRAGDARYVPVRTQGYEDAPNALAQRGLTPEHRLYQEHRVEAALGAFGYADDLTGELLGGLVG